MAKRKMLSLGSVITFLPYVLAVLFSVRVPSVSITVLIGAIVWFSLSLIWEMLNKLPKKLKSVFRIVFVLFVLFALVVAMQTYAQRSIQAKPVIYLYPPQEQEVSVQLFYQGEIIASYPEYDKALNGWKVVAHPDGRIVNLSDGNEYSYLFWEGLPGKNVDYNLSEGFIVKGEDTIVFLQDTLRKLGLTPKEYNEFIVYWYPLMQKNDYNLIHFAAKEYEDVARLDISPKPDSILRVFMVYKAVKGDESIPAQEIKPFKREGFTVVEWGGSEL